MAFYMLLHLSYFSEAFLGVRMESYSLPEFTVLNILGDTKSCAEHRHFSGVKTRSQDSTAMKEVFMPVVMCFSFLLFVWVLFY